jgi:uncharacterized protein DUF4232
MTTRARLLATLVVGLALVAGLASSTIATARAETAVTAAPACETSGLVVWLDTRANGTAGSAFYELRFTNLSGHACTLVGYPDVSAIGLNGRRLGSEAARNSHSPTRAVRLGIGGLASALLQITDVGNFPRSACRPTTAAGLRVYPPNQTGSKVIPFPFSACSRTGLAYLHVAVVS